MRIYMYIYVYTHMIPDNSIRRQEVFAVLQDELSNCTPLADEFLNQKMGEPRE